MTVRLGMPGLTVFFRGMVNKTISFWGICIENCLWGVGVLYYNITGMYRLGMKEWLAINLNNLFKLILLAVSKESG